MFNALTATQKAMLDQLVMRQDAAIEAIGIMAMLGDFEPIKYVEKHHKAKFELDVQTDLTALVNEIQRVELALAMQERETAVVN